VGIGIVIAVLALLAAGVLAVRYYRARRADQVYGDLRASGYYTHDKGRSVMQLNRKLFLSGIQSNGLAQHWLAYMKLDRAHRADQGYGCGNLCAEKCKYYTQDKDKG
jgi:hypothetical protein